MSNQYLIGEITEIYSLLNNLKQEYNKNIRLIVKQNSSQLFSNIHTIPKLKKIHINRGLGLKAQNENILKKNIKEFEKITGQKPIITKARKSIAGFKIRKDMKLGLKVTLRNEKMYTFLTKLIFFTFVQIRDFQGFSIKSFDKAGNYSFSLKDQLIFPDIDYDEINQIEGLTITIVIENCLPKNKLNSINKILNGIILFKFLHFPLNDYGYYDKYNLISEIIQNWNKKKHLKRKRWSQI